MMGRFALLGCVVLSALVATSPAQAEGSCPTGMFPIRSGINGHLAGCHPIYNSGEAQYSPSWNPPSRREPTIGEVTIHRRSYVAVVLHPKSADVWATWNQRSDEQAQQSALKACNQVMGNGCLVASSGYNGSVAIGYSPDKRVWVGWGEGLGDARDQMKQYCAQGKQKCELKHIFSGVSWPENLREPGVSEIDHSENYFPGLPGQGQKHVMMAWPKVASKTLPWRNSVWLGSGQQVTETAKQRLLDKYKQESSNECKIGLASPNGVIVRYFDSSLGVVWSTHASRKAAKSAIEFRCLLANLKCEILDVYDAETSRLEVIGTTKKINRGYLAVAWPGTSKSSWRNIVVSTGNATSREAQAAAIAHCETESRAKCVSLGDIDDLAGRFFGLYLDSQDKLRSYDSFTEEQIETYAQDDCSATDVSCQKMGMFNTHKSGTIVQSIGN